MNMLRIVILTLICTSSCCAFAGDSCQESKPGNEKSKGEANGSYRVTKYRRNRHIPGLKSLAVEDHLRLEIICSTVQSL